MALGVNGYLELYTTLIGWQQYQNLWNILVKTGIAFIPFIAIVLRNIIEPNLSQQAKSASDTSLKRMEMQLLGALVVVMLCAQPAISLQPSALNYVPICQDDKQTATPGNTGTTYDQAFPQATSAQVPIFWYAVMAISHAITRSAILGLPCEPYDYRQLHNTLAVAKIQDPQLRQEATEFYQACYVQALAKFEREKPDISPYTQKTGDADTQWLGSNAFLNMQGYYDTLSAATPVKGFAYDPNRDFEYGDNHGQWGRPNCRDWWAGTNGENGLRTRLVQALPKPIFGFLETHQDEEDNAIKSVLRHTYDRGYESLNDQDSGHWISKTVGESVGMALENLTYYPKLMLIKEALPNVQAVCLMLIYIFLAVAQPFTQYRVKSIAIGTFIIFSMTFWTFIWYLVDNVDQILMQSLYPDLLGQGSTPQEGLVDMVIGTGYVLAPMLWTLFLSWLGIQAGNGISSFITGSTAPGAEAGVKAGNLAQQGISMAATRGISSISKPNTKP